MWITIIITIICSILFIYLIHSIIQHIKNQFTEPIIRYDNEINEKVKMVLNSINLNEGTKSFEETLSNKEYNNNEIKDNHNNFEKEMELYFEEKYKEKELKENDI